jgi:hypothetical protein
MAGVLTPEEVVCTHNRPTASLDYCRLECREIYLI